MHSFDNLNQVIYKDVNHKMILSHNSNKHVNYIIIILNMTIKQTYFLLKLIEHQASKQKKIKNT